MSYPTPSVSPAPRRPRGWLIRHPLIYLGLVIFFVLSYSGHWLPSVRDLPQTPEARPVATAGRSFEDLLREGGDVPLGTAVAFVVPLICGSGLLLGYLILRAHDVRVFPRCEFPKAPWNLWDLLRSVAVIAVVSRLVEAAVVAVRLHQLANPRSASVPSVIIKVLGGNATVALSCVFVLALVGCVAGKPFRRLGLRERHPVRRALLGLVGWLMVFPVVFVVGLLVFVLGPRVGVRPEFQEVLRESLGLPPAALAVVLVGAVVVAPVAEEILFRGFLYATLRRSLGPLAAIVLSSAIFSLLHSQLTAAPSLFVIGFLLAYLYERTGSLVASISAHAANNLYSLLVVYLTFREGLA